MQIIGAGTGGPCDALRLHCSTRIAAFYLFCNNSPVINNELKSGGLAARCGGGDARALVVYPMMNIHINGQHSAPEMRNNNNEHPSVCAFFACAYILVNA